MTVMSGELPDFDARWNYDDPAASEQAFRELLPLAEGSGDEGYHMELLTQIARAEGLQRKFQQAHATLDIAGKMHTGEPRAHARYMLERGRVFNSQGEIDGARQMFEQALDIAIKGREDFYAVDALHMLAIVAEPDDQLAWNLKALELANSSADERARGWRGSLFNNIGWTYHDQGRYMEALDAFEQALHAREETGDPGPTRITRWCVARALRSLGRVEEALARQQELLQDFAAAGAIDGYVHEELAECLHALGRQAEAQTQFARAYAELAKDSWLVASEPERIARLKELGGVRD
jgi:tetratricopeptide (TPR) repeat protein